MRLHWWASLLVLTFAAHLSRAAITVYRCQNNGQITLTDKPCEGAGTNATSQAATIPSKTDPSTIGIWKGQVQYQGVEAGVMIQDAHSVVALTLDFATDGKVSGGSPDNGCEWLGIWSQGGKGLERLISVDISFKGCRYAGFNRRYTGNFLLGIPDSTGAMRLQAYTPPFPGTKVRGYDASGTLRRIP